MDAIGGYRLVRKLGEGPRAEVHLGRLDAEADGEASVVVKHYRPGVDEAAISTEIEALARGVGEHTVALLDVTTAPSGQLALILARLSGGSLGRLLAHRSSLNTGEVVGILAPLAATVEALHTAGVIHGGIRLDAVLFDGSGTPVLACFGGAGLIQPGLPPALLDPQLGAEHDRRALAAVARAVLEHADDDDAVRPVLDWLAVAATDAAWSSELGEQVRDLGAAAPIDLRASPAEVATSAIPARIPLLAPAPEVRRADLRRWAGGAGQDIRPTGFAAVATTFLDRAPGGAAVASSVLRSLGAVRLRVWAIAGAVLAALVLSLVFVPAMGGAPVADAAPEPVISVTAAPGAAGPPLDEEPAEALVRLLEARDVCLQERSVLCLDSVGQQGSAALAADQELVLGLQRGAETPPPFLIQRTDVGIVEELGGAVLLSVDGVADSQPATILIAKGDAGWLLRDYLER